MPEPKVFVFAPADSDSLKELESAGCSLLLGSANWSDPTGDSTERLAEMASGADALAGTSIKGAKISREVLTASEGLRIVAKYTVGVDEIDIDAATELGILVTHAPDGGELGRRRGDNHHQDADAAQEHAGAGRAPEDPAARGAARRLPACTWARGRRTATRALCWG